MPIFFPAPRSPYFYDHYISWFSSGVLEPPTDQECYIHVKSYMFRAKVCPFFFKPSYVHSLGQNYAHFFVIPFDGHSLEQNYAHFFVRLPYCHSLEQNYAHCFVRPPLWPFVKEKLCPILRECTRTVLLVRARLCPFFFEVVSRSHRERHCMCRSDP